MGEPAVPIVPPEEPIVVGGLVVRLPRAGDVEALVGFGDDPDTAETLWVPIPCPCSQAEAEARLHEFSEGWSGASTFGPTFIVEDQASGEFVGIVFLRAREDAVIEIAYGTAPRHRGRGIATRVLRSVSAWCFELHAARIELLISQGNHASRRVATKAGFEYRGIRRTRVACSEDAYEDLLYVREAPNEVARGG
jgi:RimJ/RimL family protein N-acetyltransferase